jgi:PurA-like ssDNA and RNA-binding protein
MRKEGSKSRVLTTDKLHIENKTLFVDLKENEVGRFLQIAELSNDRRSTVVIPISGLEAFMDALRKISDSLSTPGLKPEPDEDAF